MAKTMVYTILTRPSPHRDKTNTCSKRFFCFFSCSFCRNIYSIPFLGEKRSVEGQQFFCAPSYHEVIHK